MAKQRRTSDEKRAVLDRENTNGGGRNTVLTRRSYVKSVAATATAAAVLGAAATAGAVEMNGGYTTEDRDGYTEYVVDSGSALQVNVGDGETFENALIDIEADGASVQIITNGGGISSNWEIRNVAVKGQQPPGGGFAIVPATNDEGLVENVYLGDGCVEYPTTNYGPNPGAMWVPPEHTGHATVRNVYLSGWIDNGLYFSAPSDVGNNGGPHFTIEGCYAYDNTISCYRIGNQDTVRDSYCMASNSNPGTHRGIWAYGGSSELTIENCRWEDDADSDLGLIIGDGTTAHVSDSAFDGYRDQGVFDDRGGNEFGTVDDSVPEGCPTSAEEAAAGASEATGDEDSTDDTSGTIGIPETLLNRIA